MSLAPTASISAIFGVVVAVLGASTLLGWSFGIPELVRIRPQWTVMVLSTALCLIVGGSALIASAKAPLARRPLIRTLCGCLLALTAVAVLVELTSGLSLGIDFPELHRRFDTGYPHPGRMASNTAVALLCFALALIAIDRLHGRHKTIVLRVLTSVVIVIGGFSLAGYALRLDFLYSWAGAGRMAAHTAVAIIALGAGLWNLRYPGQRYLFENDEVKQIQLIASIILSVVVVIAGLVCFAFLQHRFEQSIAEQLSRTLRDRREFFDSMIQLRTERAVLASTNVSISEHLAALTENRGNAAARTALDAIGNQLLGNGFSVVVFESNEHVTVRDGSFRGPPTLEVAVRSAYSYPVKLAWRDGYYLIVEVSVRDRANRTVGRVLTEQQLPRLTALVKDIDSWGKTGDMAVCASEGNGAACFPQRSRREVFRMPLSINGQPLPIFYALNNQVSVRQAIDFRGTRVLVAHAPIGNTGLGMLIKMDMTELFAPIREQFQLALPFLGLLVMIGAWFVRSRLRPLAEALVSARRQAQANEARFVAATESNLDAFFILETVRSAAGSVVDFRLAYLNGQSERLLTRERGQLLGRGIKRLVGAELLSRNFAEYVRVMSAGAPLVNEFFVTIVNKGTVWYAHQVVHFGDNLAVTMRDITDRRLAQERLQRLAQFDPLTELPNRALFFDRLNSAIKLAARNRTDVALMYIDIDRFKSVNDNYGHAAGDILLREFAKRLQVCLRASDTVGRLAGDEFAILLGTVYQRSDAEVIALKITYALRDPIDIGSTSIVISASIGIAYMEAMFAVTAERLLGLADSALYSVKRQGRGSYRLVDSSPGRRISGDPTTDRSDEPADMSSKNFFS